VPCDRTQPKNVAFKNIEVALLCVSKNITVPLLCVRKKFVALLCVSKDMSQQCQVTEHSRTNVAFKNIEVALLCVSKNITVPLLCVSNNSVTVVLCCSKFFLPLPPWCNSP